MTDAAAHASVPHASVPTASVPTASVPTASVPTAPVAAAVACVLIGPMGAGKTSIGRRIARSLGTGFLDTDAMIVAEHGPISVLFETAGEPAFRAIERSAVQRALATGGVVSLGGGAILDAATRADLARYPVVLLTVSEAAVDDRLSSGRRPLLVDGLETWRRINEERRALYDSVASHTVDTSRRPITAIADEIAEWVAATPTTQIRPEAPPMTDPPIRSVQSTAVRIPVRNAGDYDVVVGRDLFGELPAALGPAVKKVLIVHQPVQLRRAEAIKALLSGSIEVILAEVPDAEDAKRVEVAAFCWQVLGQADFTRSDAIIGIGGGAVTDLAGFVAATWLRGVRVVQIPTSVLGMVDAAVGGKTGINTAEGKNLVGVFHAPAAVLADLSTLETLPQNDLLAGFAEVAKCGFIADTTILDDLEADVDAATNIETPVFASLIERAIRVKADVVSEDFREGGRREILNYGHTLGHAIEYAERYKWRHGSAVSVGMMFAAELARLTNRLTDDEVDRHRRILDSLSLPLGYPAGRWNTLLAAMRRDKKARGGMLRFVLLDGIGHTSTLNGPEDHLLFTAFSEVAT